jgi:hypothetical protein
VSTTEIAARRCIDREGRPEIAPGDGDSEQSTTGGRTGSSDEWDTRLVEHAGAQPEHRRSGPARRFPADRRPQRLREPVEPPCSCEIPSEILTPHLTDSASAIGTGIQRRA